MRATYIYGAGDIRVINVPDPAIQLIPATLVCGREEYGCLALSYVSSILDGCLRRTAVARGLPRPR